MKSEPCIRLGTKAETLERLRPQIRLSKIAEIRYFEVAQWLSSRKAWLDLIQSDFKGGKIAVRSSAQCEDSAHSSMAGAYCSVLDVDPMDSSALSAAIQKVISSYRKTALGSDDQGGSNPSDQVLIQPMIRDIAVCGVITTHVVSNGAPYCVINYDDHSGKPDTITGGIGANKTVAIHHDAKDSMIASPRILRWLEMVREIERSVGPEPIDIEFIETRAGDLYLTQARRIATQASWKPELPSRIREAQSRIQAFITERSKANPALFGSRTILGEMPDWNPAEIIGTSPRPLASSLYRFLITERVWREARGELGYRNPADEELMVLVGGRPFIDVRCSFNSFLPAGIAPQAGHRLVDAWLDRLSQRPELHDKVEFEIAHTALDCTFDGTFEARYSGVLSGQELRSYKNQLQGLTFGMLSFGNGSKLDRALSLIESLQVSQARRRSARSRKAPLQQALELLDECRTLGTMPFAILARHAFVAEALLRSIVARGALRPERVDEFKRSLDTIARELTERFQSVCQGKLGIKSFLDRFGHLRPGTYDILSLRYDQREDLFQSSSFPEIQNPATPFELSPSEKREISLLLRSEELAVSDAGDDSAARIMEFAKSAIRAREFSKFVFTRNLSDALEQLALWGQEVGLSRDDLSFLEIGELLGLIHASSPSAMADPLRLRSEESRRSSETSRSLMLSYLIRDESDIFVVPFHRSAPNFITQKRVEGRALLLHSRAKELPSLRDGIVCIENADPGFDWIFTRGIRGLITKFGGSNSHMAIRCAEFGLPAAIGCGEQAFDRLVQGGWVELNCADKIVRPVHE